MRLKKIRIIPVMNILFAVALVMLVLPTGAAANETRRLEQAPGWFQLLNVNSRKCLVVRGHNNESHAIQYLCDEPYPDQRWQYLELGNDVFLLQNQNSGKCLVVRGHNNESQAVQYECDPPYRDQLWLERRPVATR
jgi:hypothetical protein